ncbi:MAG: sulfite exporter TauE/SafE family protein [Acidobacteriota bacterium]
MTTLGLLSAVGIGFLLGVFGGGGSIVTVPVLVYALGFAPKQAIATSLVVVGVTSMVGTAVHWRRGTIEVRPAALIGGVATAGSFAGARAAVWVSGAVQLTILAVVMLLAAGSMLHGGRTISPEPPAEGSPSFALGSFMELSAIAIGIGALTGLVGIGGGFLFVPALVLVGGLPMRQATGTSLLVISMNAVAGFAGYFGRVDIPWSVVSWFGLAAIVGVVARVRLAGRIPERGLQQSFGVFLVVVAAFILLGNAGWL